MTIDKELVRELAHRYFSGEMPEELERYLFDYYGEEPLEGELAPQFFFPAVLSDIRKYVCGELDTSPRTELQRVKERYEELSVIISSMAEDKKMLEKENQYLNDFIRWRHLEESYQDFRERAYPERDRYGFEYYIL